MIVWRRGRYGRREGRFVRGGLCMCTGRLVEEEGGMSTTIGAPWRGRARALDRLSPPQVPWTGRVHARQGVSVATRRNTDDTLPLGHISRADEGTHRPTDRGVPDLSHAHQLNVGHGAARARARLFHASPPKKSPANPPRRSPMRGRVVAAFTPRCCHSGSKNAAAP